MQAAKSNLLKAGAALQRAEHNKGGHRANAIGLVNSAISQINQGIQFSRRHNYAESVPADQPNDQPNMRAALDDLRDAKQNLEQANADKGGHRVKALDFVNQAIDEVKKGIEAGS
jgi:hypothetical protein